jgi:hypothetical protein
VSDEKKVFITSVNQSGGITAQTVNLGPSQRHLGQKDAALISANVPKDATIKVQAVMNDPEAYRLADEALQWLKANGYQNVSGVDLGLYIPPPVGSQLREVGTNEYLLLIGHHPPQ